MVKIQFQNGRIVEFEKQPTEQEIDEVAKKIGAINQSAATQAKPLIEPNQPSGLLQSMAQGIISPFARTTATGLSAVKGLGGAVLSGIQALLGQKDTAKQTLAKAAEPVILGQKGGYLGQYLPFGIDEFGNPLSGIKTAQQAAGGGLEIASWHPAIGAVKGLTKATLLGKMGQGAKTAAGGGAIASGMMGAGSEMQRPEATFGEVATTGIMSSALGGLGGGLLGGALPIFPAFYRSVNPSINDALFRAIKPGKNKTYFDKSLKQSTPILAQTEKEMGLNIAKSEKPLEDFVKLLEQSKRNIWKSWKQLISPLARMTVNGNHLANKIDGMVTDTMKLLNPTITERIKFFTSHLRKRLDVEQLEDYLKGINAELSGYYAKNPAARRYAQTNPETAYLVKTAQVIREAIYSKLGEVTGNTGKQLRQLYGALDDVWEETSGRYNVAMRQAPMNLQETIHTPFAIARAIGSTMTGNPIQMMEPLSQLAFSKWMKELNTTEELIRRAFSKMRGIKYEPLPKIKPIPQLLLPGSGQTSGAIKLPSAGVLEGQAKTGIQPPQQMYGAVAGLELDENGKLRFNPEKAAGGVLAMGAMKKITKPVGQSLNAGFKGFKDLTTKFLDYAKGKTTLSRQEILDFARRPELKKGEADLLLKKLEEFEREKLYHGTRDMSWFRKGEKIKPSETGMLGHGGVFFTTDLQRAKGWSDVGKRQGDLLERGVLSLSPQNKKSFNLKKLTEAEYEQMMINEGEKIRKSGKEYFGETQAWENVDKKLQKQGYDGVQFNNGNGVLFSGKDVGLSEVGQNSSKILAQDFANSIRRDLLELKPVKVRNPEYKRTTLRESQIEANIMRGEKVKVEPRSRNYEEVVFEAPITTNGSSHFPNSKNYFAHARGDEVVEGGKKIWREQEIQSDLLQKDNLERAVLDKTTLASGKEITSIGSQNRFNQLSPFTNDRFGERIMRERIREKAQKGYSKYRLPTGETIGKIEGFEPDQWRRTSDFRYLRNPDELKVGMEIDRGTGRRVGEDWIITDILGDGRFKAVPKERFDRFADSVKKQVLAGNRRYFESASEETFDLTGKSNPQYRRYENWGKFLKNKYGGKQITDPQGNTWVEIDLKKEYKTKPIEAFGMSIAPLPILSEIRKKLEEESD